jgi:hypothetical protein
LCREPFGNRDVDAPRSTTGVADECSSNLGHHFAKLKDRLCYVPVTVRPF